jgi:putative heme-binding domain-containing protein
VPCRLPPAARRKNPRWLSWFGVCSRSVNPLERRDRRLPASAKLRAVCAVVVLVAAGGRFQAQTRARQYASADIQYGSRVYAAQCAVCHGASGNVVAGVDLRSGQLRRASTDAELYEIITTGIPGTAMPPFSFNASELTGIVAYVRNMRDFDARSVPLGDPARGKAVFESAGGCARCHRVDGRGPRLAPDLSSVGAYRTADALQRTILDPDANVIPMNRSVRAVMKDGKVITGRRLNEDTYSVQLIDEREHLLSLDKADVREYTVIKGSSMPPFRDKLAAGDLADLVAYLLSLKGQ